MQAPLRSPHRASYTRFLEEGFERLLCLLFPRRGAGVELHYVGMLLGEPMFSEQVCLALEQTYRCPVWLTLRLTPRSDATQSFLLGEIPILTERDTLARSEEPSVRRSNRASRGNSARCWTRRTPWRKCPTSAR